MKRMILLLLVLSCLFSLAACFGGGGADSGIVFMVNGDVMMQVATDEGGSLKLSAPTSSRAAECVGWLAQKGEEIVFLPIGAEYTYEREEHTVFEPIFLSGETSADVGIYYTTATYGMSFSAKMVGKDWAALSRLSSGVTCGFLVTPTYHLIDMKGTLTHSALASKNVTPIDLAAAVATVPDQAGNVVMTGLLSEISSEDYWVKYSAVAYVRVAYSDGTTGCFYLNGAPSASVRELACALLDSMSEEEKNALGDDEKTILANYTQNVRVVVKADGTQPGRLRFDETKFQVKRTSDSEMAGTEGDLLWRRIMNLLPIRFECALVITDKGGFQFSAENFDAVVYEDGKPLPAQRFCIRFFEGALIVGYTNYSINV